MFDYSLKDRVITATENCSNQHQVCAEARISSTTLNKLRKADLEVEQAVVSMRKRGLQKYNKVVNDNYAAAIAMVKRGMSIRNACKRSGISRTTYYKFSKENKRG